MSRVVLENVIGKASLLPEAKDIVHEAEIVDEPPRPRSRR